MAEAVVNILIEQLASLLVDELKLLGGVRQQVAQIKDDLRSMTAFLKDAETRQDAEEGVKEWVKQVRELAFDTEDVLDEFLLRMGAPHRPGFMGFLHRSKRFIRHLRARHQIATQIQDIKGQITAVSQRGLNFSFKTSNQHLASTSHHQSFDPRLSSLFVEESELVGIDNIRNEFVERLTQGETKLTVISVVGEGGLGKTTLVRKVYTSQSVQKHCDCYAWITVSQSYKPEEIFRSLIKQLIINRGKEESLSKGMDAMNCEELVDTLRTYLVEKRYVVIFDDIWRVNAWDDLKFALPTNEKGSRIIVTTRNHTVASYCTRLTDSQENQVYPFKPLPPSDAWDLFCRKAFPAKNGGTCPPHLKGLCEKIVKRCGGMPLAIVAIGGLLSTKNLILSEWKLVHGSLGTEIETNDTLKGMSTILWLSYNDLPYYLKSCFLYFSHFPEDYTVKRARLTRMWVAEGFIKPDRKNIATLDEIAEAYLNELVTRSLIQVSKVDFYGRVESCRVHDLIRELILQKTEEEKFCMSLTEENTRLHDKTRHLSSYNVMSLVFSEDDCRFLRGVRSLYMLRVSYKPAMLSSFRLLKVLTLERIDLLIFPSEIVNLFHLRYLNMRSTRIEEIPNSIGKLQNLQTLDIKYSNVTELPKGILKLKQLRHLLVGWFGPVSGVKLPTGIGCLNCLEKLFYINVEKREVVKELGKLRQLRRLGIMGLRGEDVESLFDSISHMKELQSLSIRGGGFGDASFLSNYSLPLPRSIYLSGPLLNLTNWMPPFENLVKLRLNSTSLRDDPLKSLPYLPYLALLCLLGNAYEGEELSCEGGGFPSLRVLRISGLRELRCVRFEEGAMPQLEELFIYHCERLEELPIGIEHLTSLKELDLEYNSDKLDEIIKGSEGKIGRHQMMDISDLNESMGSGELVESMSAGELVEDTIS